MLKLFYTRGACSMVPHIAPEEAGAQYEKVLIDFRAGDQLRPEFLKVNPKARVPVLLTDRGVLTEIPAILGAWRAVHGVGSLSLCVCRIPAAR
jgi:glutathione S-transferase